MNRNQTQQRGQNRQQFPRTHDPRNSYRQQGEQYGPEVDESNEFGAYPGNGRSNERFDERGYGNRQGMPRSSEPQYATDSDYGADQRYDNASMPYRADDRSGSSYGQRDRSDRRRNEYANQSEYSGGEYGVQEGDRRGAGASPYESQRSSHREDSFPQREEMGSARSINYGSGSSASYGSNYGNGNESGRFNDWRNAQRYPAGSGASRNEEAGYPGGGYDEGYRPRGGQQGLSQADRARVPNLAGGYPEEPRRTMSANPSARAYYGGSQGGPADSAYSGTSRRGKAPRGYRRSDERIREDISERIMDHGDLDASDVQIDVASGVVTLQGTCGCRHSKHAIEEIADSISGVTEVDNQVKVKRSTEDKGQSGSDAASGGRYSQGASAGSSQGSALSGSTGTATSSSRAGESARSTNDASFASDKRK